MKNVIAEMQRMVPGTDAQRYDAAYEQGRAQARSSLLFGGLATGLVMGAIGMFLLDPTRGKGRRAEIRQRATGVANDVSHTAEGRARDMRNRATGLAHDVGITHEDSNGEPG